MTPEQEARILIDKKLEEAGWTLQKMEELNPRASLGVAVREFATDTGPVDYVLFIDGEAVGVVEAKPTDEGENITVVENQSKRYAESEFKRIKKSPEIRFAYEATDLLIRFTDYKDEKYRSREVFSFHRPEFLEELLEQDDTVRNNLKRVPEFDETGFRDCQVTAITNLNQSFAENKPRALVQMATGAGKTFTAITQAYRLLKYGKMKRILFLVDTKGLGEQAESEFLAYKPNDDPRSFSQLYGVKRLSSSYIPNDVQVCISTVQRMYSILKEEDLDDADEEESLETYVTADSKTPKEVVYNEKYPPEFFDCIIIDECHRSIYNVWQQVLTYFDAFLIGLTATPDKRTFAFFNENLVSEYRREQAIIDGVNVGEDIYHIDTEVTQKGGQILKRYIEYRERKSRKKRWAEMDEDIEYDKSTLDKSVVNPSQIRTVIRTFKEKLETELFPYRKEVPKTLIFAKTDSHADDIINIVREEFGEGNEFCKKITHAAKDADTVLTSFRNDFYPRIAVTVNMIATGTDIKPLECLIFMRDVRSKNFYEHMVGRGTRTLSLEDLKKVSPSATESKDHFVIVDAVGVTNSKKIETKSFERKLGISLKELMLNVALGDDSEDTLNSLAERITRLDKRLTKKEQKDFVVIVGASARDIAYNLLHAHDEDTIFERAQELASSDAPNEKEIKKAQKSLLREATDPFFNPDARDFIENVHKNHTQIIDSVNIDSVLFAGYDSQKDENVSKTILTFREFIEENKDEIIALRIIYNESYKDRPMVIQQLKALYETLQQENLTVDRVWEAYATKDVEKVKKRSTMAQITDLISLIRYEMGVVTELSPFADCVNQNFKDWTFKKNAGYLQFTEDQMEWLRLIKEHIISSLSILEEDFDYTPFDRKGGLICFYEAFGDNYKNILYEMNVELVA